jgi:ATP-dependent 26S proteasome regulatory subunit
LQELLDTTINTKDSDYSIGFDKYGNKHLLEKSKKNHNIIKQSNTKKAILNIKSIIENSRFKEENDVDLTHNKKQSTLNHKNRLDKYITFITQIKVDNTIYDVELTTDKYKKDVDNNIICN